jgi:hypothetical protein
MNEDNAVFWAAWKNKQQWLFFPGTVTSVFYCYLLHAEDSGYL